MSGSRSYHAVSDPQFRWGLRVLETRARGAFTHRLAEQAAEDEPPFTLDYWRLNIMARRP